MTQNRTKPKTDMTSYLNKKSLCINKGSQQLINAVCIHSSLRDGGRVLVLQCHLCFILLLLFTVVLLLYEHYLNSKQVNHLHSGIQKTHVGLPKQLWYTQSEEMKYGAWSVLVFIYFCLFVSCCCLCILINIICSQTVDVYFLRSDHLTHIYTFSLWLEMQLQVLSTLELHML